MHYSNPIELINKVYRVCYRIICGVFQLLPHVSALLNMAHINLPHMHRLWCANELVISPSAVCARELLISVLPRLWCANELVISSSTVYSRELMISIYK